MARETAPPNIAPPPDSPGMKRVGYAAGGDEEAVRRHMRISSPGRGTTATGPGAPVKGGHGADDASERLLNAPEPGATGPAGGEQVVFVLARKGEGHPETPVFRAGDAGTEDAVAVFTGREAAARYLQVARWGDRYEAVGLAPSDLARWLEKARGEGVHLAAVDLGRQSHLAGEPQRVLSLEEQAGRAGEEVYREVMARARYS